MQENLVCLSDLRKINLKPSMNLHQVFNLEENTYKLMTQRQRYKYGIQQGSSHLNLSLVLTTKGTYKQQSRSIAAFLVYDISKRQTFENITKWLSEVKSYANDKVQLILVANKTDLQDKRQVSKGQGQQLAKANDLLYYETSALKNQGVDDLFKDITKKILKRIEKNQINPDVQTSYGIKKGKKNAKSIHSIGNASYTSPNSNGNMSSLDGYYGQSNNANKPRRLCCNQ